MEPETKAEMGICYECSTKNGDSSKKQVYRCDLCEKWFCEKHLKPKFPYFVDWETVFNVDGDPRIKTAFYTEYKREGGHPDFIFLRKTIENSELEEKKRNQLIKQAIDRMEEANRERRIKRREEDIREKQAEEAEEAKLRAIGKATTIENRYSLRVIVTLEVYSNAEYREYINYAQTVKSVRVIVDEYYRKYGKRKKLEKSPKKKHWWQKS
jgi:hypothetical protein